MKQVNAGHFTSHRTNSLLSPNHLQQGPCCQAVSGEAKCQLVDTDSLELHGH